MHGTDFLKIHSKMGFDITSVMETRRWFNIVIVMQLDFDLFNAKVLEKS